MAHGRPVLCSFPDPVHSDHLRAFGQQRGQQVSDAIPVLGGQAEAGAHQHTHAGTRD